MKSIKTAPVADVTPVAIVADADQKVRATSIKTMGDITALLQEAEALPGEILALNDILSGTSSVAAACVNHGLVVGEEVQANYVNRFRNRTATIFLSVFKNICEPVSKKNAKVANAETAIEDAKNLADKMAAWIAGGERGRKPGEGNRPKWEIALEKAHAEARRFARQNLDIAEQGRITPDMQENFVKEFRTIYTEALNNLAKKYPDHISGETENIEKLANKGVKLLAVEKSAQKVGLNSTKPKTPKNAEIEIPVTDTDSVVEPEPVEAE